MKVLITASGPSLMKAHIDYAKDKVDLGIAISDSYLLYPSADILFSSNDRWYTIKQPVFKGNKYCLCHTPEADVYVEGREGVGFSSGPYVHYGRNSGFAAINLALLLGGTEIYLLGYDMGLSINGARHFFGEHPKPLNRDSPYNKFIKEFKLALPSLDNFKATVVNCTEGGNLDVFVRKSIYEAF
jgi:hypothetical protein